jgi:hypothetical protein
MPPTVDCPRDRFLVDRPLEREAISAADSGRTTWVRPRPGVGNGACGSRPRVRRRPDLPVYRESGLGLVRPCEADIAGPGCASTGSLAASGRPACVVGVRSGRVRRLLPVLDSTWPARRPL